MTPKEIQAALIAFKATVGERADVSAVVTDRASQQPLNLTVWPAGLCHSQDCRFTIDADDWQELLDAAAAKWAEHKEIHRAQITKKMALAIIATTSAFGTCSAAALRGNGFSGEDVIAYGAEACTEANKMAESGPFTIAPAPGANAPASGIDAEHSPRLQ